MKKLFVLFLLFNTLFSQAQIQDLAEMASGDLVNFQALYDENEKFYGYFALYNQGEIDKKTKKFEYFLFDKNLNQINSNTIVSEIKNQTYYAYFNFNGELILAPYVDYSKVSFIGSGKFVFPEHKKVDIKTNIISIYHGKCYENNKFLTCEPNKSWRDNSKDEYKELREKGFVERTDVYNLKKGKTIVTQYKEYLNFIKDNVIMYFDENDKMVWKYEYNNFADKKNSESIFKIDIDDKAFYGIKTITKKRVKSYYLIAIDITNGNVLAEKEITGLSGETIDELMINKNSENYIKTFTDKIVICSYNFDDLKDIGYARIIVNKNDFTFTTNTLLYKDDLHTFIPKIDKYGYVESGYFLLKKDVFYLKDGSVAILTEKFKPERDFSKKKTTDMVYIVTDKDFKVTEVKTLEKEKSKGQYTDYLFSQYLNNDQDVVFFYKDFQKDDESKDKNWILFINTLQNGVFKKDQTIISSKNDKFTIYPYVAKEGYILLREYNQKDKYNQIRLEKLNY